jgi:phage protein D
MPDTSNLLSQFYVKIDGTDASEEFMHDLIEVTVESSLHLPDVATLILHDTHLKYIDDARLAPGKTLEVSAKSGQKTDPLFDGEIVELEPDFRPGDPHLVVRAFDRLHRLARGRTVRSFLNVTDDDIVRKIAQEVGLQVEMDSTSQVYPYVLQSNQTNLDFLKDRASALGFLLFVRKKTLHCEAPKPVGSPIELEWGKTLMTFQPRMTTVDQVDDVVVRGWDPETRQEILGQAKNGNGATKVGEKKSGGELAHAAFNLTAHELVTDRPVRTQATADRLAQAVADQIAGRFIEAEGTCGGNPAIIAGASLQISAVGERFSGTYLVTSAHHTFSAKAGYGTEFSVSGHRAATLLNLIAPDESPEQVPGLMIGIVTDNQDPEKQGRIKVKFPTLSGEHASNWARVSSPGGGSGRGFQFLPEVNDEVLIGFELGDIHYPYVLGGLWNGRDAPSKSSDQAIKGGKVEQRIIRSRSGHMITLDDSEGGGGITIEDSKGNKIHLDTQTNDLTIQVQGNLNLKADRNISIEANGQIDMKASATVDVKGAVIKLN